MEFKTLQLKMTLTEMTIDVMRLKRGDDSEQLITDYTERIVKLLATPAVSNNEVAVCPRCKSKEVSVKPVTYDCYECGATWQTER